MAASFYCSKMYVPNLYTDTRPRPGHLTSRQLLGSENLLFVFSSPRLFLVSEKLKKCVVISLIRFGNESLQLTFRRDGPVWTIRLCDILQFRYWLLPGPSPTVAPDPYSPDVKYRNNNNITYLFLTYIYIILCVRSISRVFLPKYNKTDIIIIIKRI